MYVRLAKGSYIALNQKRTIEPVSHKEFLKSNLTLNEKENIETERS